MGEEGDEPAASPKAPSSSPKAKRVMQSMDAPPEEPVNEVEITYIDPVSGQVCQRPVFCEPEDWKDRYQARLLVSSDLVNSLSEAVGIWGNRFKQVHHRLEDSRMGYYYELHSIRCHLVKLQDYGNQNAQKAADALKKKQEEDRQKALAEGRKPEEVEEPEEEEKPKEVCPVHFFNPEVYLDSWTKERYQIAIKTFRAQVIAENAVIQEKINLMGGGTWRQLLSYFMRKGQDAMELVHGCLHHIDPESGERREITNTMTNGLQDLYDALLEQLKSLEAENQDMQKRQGGMLEIEERQRDGISKAGKQIMDSKKELREAVVFVEPEIVETAEEVAEVAEAQAVFFEAKEGNLKEYMAEVRRMRKLLEEWQARQAAEVDEESIKALEAEKAEWRKKAQLLNAKAENLNDKCEGVESKVQALELQAKAQMEKVSELKENLAALGPVENPGAVLYAQLQKDMKRLDWEEKKIKVAINEPKDRLNAMRSQLKTLYQKLGWEWDMSDDEGGDRQRYGGEEEEEDGDFDDRPYWLRRKLAANGFMKFDVKEFNYLETGFQKRRKKKLSKEKTGVEKTQIIARMKARRHQVTDDKGTRSRELIVDEEEEAGPKMFGTDEPERDPDYVERAITTARERLGSLPGTREGLLETPCWKIAQRGQDREARQVELDRLLQLRQHFEAQLGECVECFVDLLPASGALGDLRLRLSETLGKLRHLPEDPAAWQAQEVEGELEQTCEALQDMIMEAISCGDQVHPISAAMVHSVKFSELRTRLFEVLQSEHDMREALKAFAGPGRRRLESSNGFSPNSSRGFTPHASRSLEPLSNSSSPRGLIRGITAPASMDSSGETGASNLAMAGRGTPSVGELSESLKLPPRLLAQTTSLLGGRQPKKDMRKKVDFGFRPDGAGEDSLENWALFKVSKASTSSGFGDSVSTGMGLTTSSGFLGDKGRKTEQKARLQRPADDCSFHEYMSQSQQMSAANWRSTSAPSLVPGKGDPGGKKNFPTLPKIIKNAASVSRSGSLMSGGSSGNRSMPRISSQGDAYFGCWKERNPLPIPTPKFSATNAKFAATAPPNAMFSFPLT